MESPSETAAVAAARLARQLQEGIEAGWGQDLYFAIGTHFLYESPNGLSTSEKVVDSTVPYKVRGARVFYARAFLSTEFGWVPADAVVGQQAMTDSTPVMSGLEQAAEPQATASEVSTSNTNYSRTLPVLNQTKPVHVGGYYRKDGTYVRPHTRLAPGTRRYQR